MPIAETSAGMRVYRVRVQPPDVVYLKSILEASEGLGAIFAEKGGDLVVAAPHERAKDLAELLADIAREIEADIDLDPSDVAGDKGDSEATPPGSTR
ncbi:DUF4911 domain-containing protein [Polyangium aurulentum]|uniref:DUF4911 domain-containing protein n=1 Tax=Polyangium aurulentum TaxID=2567896 RepID=UPI00200C3FE6|nr:DUF4911 domain-containing protein [Polyangium aurulentum]UQA63293.1 DUF4911 domain-containing protein [Polyangium aurulentum]